MAVAVATINRRALRNEAAWLPRTLEDVIAIRLVLAESGLPAQKINGVSGWLVAKAAGEEDRTDSVTRATYRKILAELESPLQSGRPIPGQLNEPFAA